MKETILRVLLQNILEGGCEEAEGNDRIWFAKSPG